MADPLRRISLDGFGDMSICANILRVSASATNAIPITLYKSGARDSGARLGSPNTKSYDFDNTHQYQNSNEYQHNTPTKP